MIHHKHHHPDRRQQFVSPPPPRRGLPWNLVLAIGAVVLLGTIAATVVGRGRGAGSAFATAGLSVSMPGTR